MPTSTPVPARTAELATMLRNRLRKRWKHLGRWAKRSGLTCFRVYDQDIPELPLVIDWYDGRVHVAEFVRRRAADEEEDEEHDQLVAALVEVVREVLGVGEAETFLKQRRRQKGKAQYEKLGEDGARFVVTEHGHAFYVNLSDYLDTGLFLDHRAMRREVAERAQGKRLLNLFAYTGAFSVYAAAAGAAETWTMDLSNTYLAWAEENFALNGLTVGGAHRFVRADCCEYLRGVQDRERFNIVVVDPPSFSNSKGMQGTFDVQRDYGWLLRAALARTAKGGVVYFSTNRRGFTFDGESANLGRDVTWEDITVRTLDEDFSGSKIHKAFRIVKSAGCSQ